MKKKLPVVLCFILVLVVCLTGLGLGWFGDKIGRGTPVTIKRPSNAPPVGNSKQILFGDFHVHTTFSLDAFM